MKYFYPLALLVVAGLTFWPLLVLEGEQIEEYQGQVVRFDVYGSAVRSLDPATCGDTTSSSFQGNVYEGLYSYHFLKRPVELVTQLAAEMPEISDDGKTYTIKIKPGVKYHRNPCFGPSNDKGHQWATRDVEARDFVLAFKRIADYHVNTGLAWAFSQQIQGIKDYRKKTSRYKIGDFSRYDLPVEGLQAVDANTLKITLDKPYPQFIYVLAMHVTAPVPREAVDYHLGTEGEPNNRRSIPFEKRTTEFREAEEVVGTGAYMWDTFERKTKIVLVRNPDYRKEYYPKEGEGGNVKLAKEAKQEVLAKGGDPNKAQAAYEEVMLATSDKGQGLLDDAGKRVPFIDVLHYEHVHESYSAWLLFLTKQRDSSGISRDIFESVVEPGKKLAPRWKKKGIKLVTYWSPAVYWIGFNMEDPVVGKSKSLRQALCLCFDMDNYLKVLFNDRGKRAVNVLPSTFVGHKEAGPGPYYTLDMDRANKKIADARKELGKLGLLDNGAIPQLELDLGGTDEMTARRGQFIQQQFAKIGVDLKINLNDWPKLQEKVNNKQIQMFTMGWHADYPDAQNFLQLFYSPNIEKQTNNTNYSNRAFDKLYDRISTMQDSPKRTELYAKMVNMISEDVPVLLLTEPEGYVLFYRWVKNVKPHPIGYGFTKYWRIDTKLRRKLGGKE
jgi:ABC-type transport system substrate-binding protein